MDMPKIQVDRYSLVPRHAAVTLAALVALAWGIPAFCGEIHEAAKQGDLAKVKALLKDNPGLVFSKDTRGGTPLYDAAAEGHKDVAKVLVANKADVNAKANNGWTALLNAASKGHRDVVALLLANKADVNGGPHNDAGTTPLFWAVKNGHKDVAELLRQNGGQESAGGGGALSEN